MDQSSQVPYPDLSAGQPGNRTSTPGDREPVDGLYTSVNREKPKSSSDASHLQVYEETHARMDDRNGRVHSIVDIAEVLRRWTHALQRIHKQSLYLAKANDGEGPELLRSALDDRTGGHAESYVIIGCFKPWLQGGIEWCFVRSSLHAGRGIPSAGAISGWVEAEVLISQLKEIAPSVNKSISELTEEVKSIPSTLPLTKNRCQSTAPIQAQSSGRSIVSPSPPALK